jgi:hypothetical protein
LTDGTNGNQVGVADPGLGALADNGGPTQTIALLPGSPAIDTGSNALAIDPSTGLPLTTDQRGAGFPRIVNGTVDIGAFEVQGAVVAGTSAGWGSQTSSLQTAADGLRLLPSGRSTDLPWLGIDKLTITLSQAEALSPGDVTITGITVANYGPVTISGSGTSYTITLAQPIEKADRVIITIGNATIATFTRELDVLPGDFNDDGVVNSQDLVLVRNEWLKIGGATATIFGDLNGDGDVDINDYNIVRAAIGTSLPAVAAASTTGASVAATTAAAPSSGGVGITSAVPPASGTSTSPPADTSTAGTSASVTISVGPLTVAAVTAPTGQVSSGTGTLTAAITSTTAALASTPTTVSQAGVSTGTTPLTVAISKRASKAAAAHRAAEAKALHRAEIRLANRGRRLRMELQQALGHAHGTEHEKR